MRKILFLIPDMQGGGAQRVASLLCNAWAENDHRVMLTTYEKQATPSFYTLSDSIEQIWLDQQADSVHKGKALISNFKRIVSVQKAIRDNKPDIVLCFGAEVTVIATIASLGIDVKIVGCERTDPKCHPTGIWAKLRDFAYKRVDSLVVQTHTAAEFCARFQNQIMIIPNPIMPPDESAVSDIKRPRRDFIASLGRLSQEKGHDLLIKAFAGIAKDYPNLDLLLIGDGLKRSDYESMASDFELKERIHFAGESKNPFSVLKQAKIFVLPSRFEGFPNALVEAMALGLPCLSTKGTIGAETIIDDGRNGLLVEGENPDAMAAFIKQMLDNPKWTKNLGAAAAKDIPENLSLEKILSYWDTVIQ